MMHVSLFGYRDTALQSQLCGGGNRAEYSVLPHGVTAAFSLLKSGLSVGYDDLVDDRIGLD